MEILNPPNLQAPPGSSVAVYTTWGTLAIFIGMFIVLTLMLKATRNMNKMYLTLYPSVNSRLFQCLDHWIPIWNFLQAQRVLCNPAAFEREWMETLPVPVLFVAFAGRG